jgi:hypothetical protein
MTTLILGIALMILGVVLFLVGRKGSKSTSVRASGGSIAIGGSNSGQITNINSHSHNKDGHGGHGVTVIAIIVEIIGIVVVIWHAIHLSHL